MLSASRLVSGSKVWGHAVAVVGPLPGVLSRVGLTREVTTKRLQGKILPLSTSVVLVVSGLLFSFWSYRLHLGFVGAWRTPGDFWATYQSSVALVQGHFSQVYSQSTGLVTFPAISYLLAPAAVLTSALHLGLGYPAGPYVHPSAWLVAGPFEMMIGSLPLFAVDRCAERLGLSTRRRWALALAEAAILANVTVLWGHPEDAISIALVLYAVLAVQDGNHRRAAWLLGVAVAFQPLALLAIPALGARFSWREALRLLPVVVVPSLLVLAPLIGAEPASVWHALVNQPNYPLLNHVTPLTRFAPGLPGGIVVMAGPDRLVAVAVAAIVGVLICRRSADIEQMLWALPVVFFIRLVFETTIAAFYVWPVLAVVLLLSARRGRVPLITVAVAANLMTWFQLIPWEGTWGWWTLTIGSLAVMLVLTRPRRVRLAVRMSSHHVRPRRWSINQVWALDLILCALIACADALLGHRIILMGLLVAIPCGALVTGRWSRTAISGALAVGLAVALGVPDGIWATATQLAYIGAIAAVALACSVWALTTERVTGRL